MTRHSRTCEWSSKCLPGMIHVPTIFPCALNLISSSCFGVEWPMINRVKPNLKKFPSCLHCGFFSEIVMKESINCLCTCICVTAWQISSFITLPERLEGVRLRGLCRRWQIALLPTVSRQCVCHVPCSHTQTHTRHRRLIRLPPQGFNHIDTNLLRSQVTHQTKYCHTEKWWVKVGGNMHT